MVAPLAGILAEATSIVVVKPSSLGDIVHTLPAVHLIRCARPDLDIRWVVNTEWAPLLEGNKDISRTVLFPRKQMVGARGILRAARFWREIRKSDRPDVVIDFQGLLRSAVIGRSYRPGHFVGLGDAREGATSFYNEILPVPGRPHAVDRYLTVPEAMGIDIPEPRDIVFPLVCDHGVDLPPLPDRYIVLHPYARGQGKALTVPQIRQLCEMLAPGAVVLVGVSENAPLLELPGNVSDLTNKTSLSELVGILRGAGFVISVDSGPMHMAAAVNPRLLGIHTWSDPDKVGPYHPEAYVWKGGSIAHRQSMARAEKSCAAEVGEDDLEEIARFVAGR